MRAPRTYLPSGLGPAGSLRDTRHCRTGRTTGPVPHRVRCAPACQPWRGHHGGDAVGRPHTDGESRTRGQDPADRAAPGEGGRAGSRGGGAPGSASLGAAANGSVSWLSRSWDGGVMAKGSGKSLATIQRLVAERVQIEHWLERLDLAGDQTPEAVRERVKTDYKTRLHDVIKELA